MRLEGDSTFSVGTNCNKVQVLNNLPFSKVTWVEKFGFCLFSDSAANFQAPESSN